LHQLKPGRHGVDPPEMRLAGVCPGQFFAFIYMRGTGRREEPPGRTYLETSWPKYLSEIFW
jgi:hypothetical protein